MRMAQAIGALAVAISLAGGPALAAGGKGVVVRLEMAGEKPAATPVVRLTNKSGKVDVSLSDRGESPDVEADDGIYSGSTLLSGDEAEVQLTIGDRVVKSEPISWDPTNSQRDVSLHLDGTALTAVTNSGTPAEGQADDAAANAGDGTTPGSTDGASTSSGGSIPGLSTITGLLSGASGGGSNAYLGLAIGILALGGLAYYTMRDREDEGGELLPALPEPPILGPGTPSISDGLSLWVCPPADNAQLSQQLLGALARHHRVLIVCPEDTTVPSAFGGPIYRAPTPDPEEVGQAAEDLMNEGGAPLALFVQLDALAAHALVEQLPDGLGGVVIVEESNGVVLPTVACARDGAQWTFSTAAGTATARVGWSGFEPVLESA